MAGRSLHTHRLFKANTFWIGKCSRWAFWRKTWGNKVSAQPDQITRHGLHEFNAGRGGGDLTTKARRHEGKQLGDGRWELGVGRWGFLTAKYTNHAKILKH